VASGVIANTAVCDSYDPRAKVGAATVKLTDVESHFCATSPSFGHAPLTRAIAASRAEVLALLHPFGYPDAPGGSCSQLFGKLIEKLLAAKLKALDTCIKDGLKAGSISSESALAACLDSTKAANNPKIAKLLGKADSLFAGKCPTEVLLCNSAACLDARVACRTCGLARGANGVTTDCEVFDDGAADVSCPDACGNGSVGTIASGDLEPCDDGNLASGDGCDADCTLTGCGNGIVTSGEFCDHFHGRCVGGDSDGLQCLENAECPGGFCTSCPSGACAADCSGCGPGACCWAAGCALLPGYGQGCAGFAVSCDAPVCQYAGTCCQNSSLGACSTELIAEGLCDDFGGTPVACSQCTPCCAFNGYCTSWATDQCLEYEGTPVDCSQCWPDTP
jgi:cysteine-rich repeat protein